MELIEDVFKAYYDARKGKRNSTNQLRFEMNLEENLVELYHEIKERRYQVGRSICFMVDYPVKREVFAADFKDRIVHHLLFNYISPIYERIFIDDCYSCRKGKGNLYGIKRLEKHIRSCSLNYTQDCYILKLDLAGYFMNINRQKLYDILVRILNKYKDFPMPNGIHWGDSDEFDLVMYLLPIVIMNDPVKNCYRKGSLSEWEGLPPNKSLFHSPEGCGIPIGNLTSQLFSNVYLNQFDQFVKRTLCMKHYGRYVDDFYLVHADKRFLLSLVPLIRDYLWNELDITLHPKKIVLQSYQKGVVFLGAVVKPYRTYIHNRATRKFKNELYLWEKRLANTPDPPKSMLLQMRASINSYLGIMRHFRTMNLKRRILENRPFLYKYGYFNNRMEKYILLKEHLIKKSYPFEP
ncbi:RNA-directed DNA polymerase [Parabacteroides bouchesdurhonensis]|uniref:RNA-directed DNA polymerase n=1 Tax=Parabacteroides bouchesdurhonensis TaxID=1936995 RepID=UPI000C866D6C|nr:RNA-directed DNA polymerase [Parabacteroides bouchesdurhonensis]